MSSGWVSRRLHAEAEREELDAADVKGCGSAKAIVVPLARDAGLVLIGWVLGEFIWTRSLPTASVSQSSVSLPTG